MKTVRSCLVVGLGVVALASYASAVEAARAPEELALRRLGAGTMIEFQTAARSYRSVLVNPATGETRTCVSANGRDWSSPRRVYLLGATPGSSDGFSLVSMGRLRVGWQVELGLDDLAPESRVLSGELTAVRVLSMR